MIAQALLSMGRKLNINRLNIAILIISCLPVLLHPSAWVQLFVVFIGVVLGCFFLSPDLQQSKPETLSFDISKKAAVMSPCLLKNISGTWVNLNFPAQKYTYLGIRAVANNKGETHIVVGKLENSTYVWNEIFSIDEKMYPVNDLNVLLDQHNNYYMINSDINTLVKLKQSGELEPLYLSQTPLEQIVYFKHDVYVAVVNTEKMDSRQHRISLLNHET